MVDDGGEEVDDGRLLATAGSAGRDEHGDVLARERALRPELARRVKERLAPREPISMWARTWIEGRRTLSCAGMLP